MRPRLDEDIHSLSEFKRNTAAMLRRMKRTKRPLVLTINGKAAMVVNEPGEYERLMATVEHEETEAGIAEGIADFEAGRFVTLNDMEKKLRARL